MTLTEMLLKWLAAYDINIEAFESFLEGIAGKINSPEEWTSEVVLWLRAHTALTEDQTSTFTTQVLAWITAPAPGYDPEHGRDA